MEAMLRISFEQYLQLVDEGFIINWIRHRVPKTIFFDEESGIFVYINRYSGKLRGCGIPSENYNPVIEIEN
jgi:AMMECR1 domain-containing protein